MIEEKDEYDYIVNEDELLDEDLFEKIMGDTLKFTDNKNEVIEEKVEGDNSHEEILEEIDDEDFEKIKQEFQQKKKEELEPITKIDEEELKEIIEDRNIYELTKLFQRKLNPNLFYQDKISFFMIACEDTKDFKIPELFLENQVDPNVKNQKGDSALAILCSKKNLEVEIFKKMFENKADVNSTNSKGESSFEILCRNKTMNSDIMKLFLENGANPNRNKDNKKDSILHTIASSKNIDSKMIQLLLENKADPNCENESKKTAFHLACANEYINIDIVSFFFDFGAKNVQDNLLNSPFHILLKNKYVFGKTSKEVTFPFLQHHCDLLLQNSEKKSVVDIAQDRDLDRVTKLFDQIKTNGTIWTQKRHHLFTKLFQKKIFYFMVSQRIYFKTRKNPIQRIFPKHLLTKILTFFSINYN